MRRYGESKAHEKAKEKVADVLRSRGFTVFVDSYPFECQTDKGERIYWPDVYAENLCRININTGIQTKVGGFLSQTGCRRIIVEVQGFAGHKSKAAFQADRLRIQDIRSSHGTDIEYYTVSINKRIGPLDIRSWSMEDICEHLNI